MIIILPPCSLHKWCVGLPIGVALNGQQKEARHGLGKNEHINVCKWVGLCAKGKIVKLVRKTDVVKGDALLARTFVSD